MFSDTFCRGTEVEPLQKGLEVGYLQALTKPEDGCGNNCSCLAPLNQILQEQLWEVEVLRVGLVCIG